MKYSSEGDEVIIIKICSKLEQSEYWFISIMTRT